MKFAIPIIILLFSPWCFLRAQITTLAGTGAPTTSGDGGPATHASFSSLSYLATDAAYRLYISDHGGYRVRMIDTGGIISTVSAGIQSEGIVIGQNGLIYLSDSSDNCLYSYDPIDSFLLLAGTPGQCGDNVDGQQAVAALLNKPAGLAMDNNQNLYLSDQRHNCVWRIDATGYMTRFAGNDSGTTCTSNFGTFAGDSGFAVNAFLNQPAGLAFDIYGNLYIADSKNNRIRKVDNNGIITTFAGYGMLGFTGDGGPAVAAQIRSPFGIATDYAGNVYFTEYGNNKIRRVDNNGIITTIAGSGLSGFSGDGGNPLLAKMNHPGGIAINQYGDIVFADVGNIRIRKVCSFTTPTIAGPAKICDTASITLTDSMAGGRWSCSNPILAGIDSAGKITFKGFGIDTFYYTIRPGCFASLKVQVDAKPSAVFGNNYACLTNDSTQVLDSVTGGIWSLTNNSASISSTGWITARYAGTDTVQYQVTNTCGTYQVDYPINVYPILTAGQISGPDILCTVDSIELSETVSGGIWHCSSAGILVDSNLIKGVSAGTDTISYTVGNSCGYFSATRVLTVFPMPYVAPISGDSVLCTGVLTTLNDTISGGIWYTGNNTALVSRSGVVLGLAAGIDTISYAFQNICGTVTTFKVITLDVTPFAGTITGGNQVCTGASILLVDSSSGGIWNLSDSTLAIINNGNLTAIKSGSEEVVYRVNSACGTATATHLVNIIASPAGLTLVGPSQACAGNAVALQATVAGGIWQVSNNLATVNGSGIFLAAGPGIDTVEYSLTNNCGTGVASVVITVDAASSQPQILGLDLLCIGGNPSQLTATPAGGTWTGSNGNASISGGSIEGMFEGIDTIYYSLRNGCGNFVATSLVQVRSVSDCDSLLGIGAFSDRIRVYPDPAIGFVNIAFPATGFSTSVHILDMTGRELITAFADAGSDNLTLGIGSLHAGCYMIRVGISDVYYARRLIVF